MKVFLLLLCSGLALANGDENATAAPFEELEPDSIITAGFSAQAGQIPYIVSLILGTDDSNHAAVGGGVIIANTWVLTAAHCLTTDYVDVHYGSNWRGKGQFYHRVRNEKFIRHQLWPKTNGNDIGLIRTPRVSFSARINKVKLPTFKQQEETFENLWALACGWGGQANGQLADWLQCANLQIMNNTECSESYGSLPNGILCVRTPGGKSTCGGDSGGPLVTQQNNLLVGITSFVSGAGCMAGQPAGFTRVTSHLSWIQKHSGVAYN